jgi:hypothetical protein
MGKSQKSIAISAASGDGIDDANPNSKINESILLRSVSPDETSLPHVSHDTRYPLYALHTYQKDGLDPCAVIHAECAYDSSAPDLGLCSAKIFRELASFEVSQSKAATKLRNVFSVHLATAAS